MTDFRDQTMMILGDLVGFPTVTTEPNQELIDYAADLLGPHGFDIRLTSDEAGQQVNLFATLGPTADGGIVLSGHTDVVPAEEDNWTGAPFVAMRRGQKIFGRGTVDMKGFIACALALAPWFKELDLKRPLHIALTAQEEIGCRGAPILIADMLEAGYRPSAAVIGEPSEMGIVVAHKGMHEYTTRFHGVGAHGSLPEHGVNAVEFATRFVGELMNTGEKLRARAGDDSPFDPKPTTINVGSIHGGVAHNIVAPECAVQWEMRPISAADAAYALDRIKTIEQGLLEEMRARSDEASVTTVTDGAVGGLEYDPDSVATALVSRVLDDPDRRVVAFSTEAGLYQSAGIPAVVCGPGSIEVAHQPNEYISLDQLERCIDMMKGLAKTLLDQ